MTDETERPEDTVRRFAQRCAELEEWQQRYAVAAELWESLELHDNDQVTEAVIIAKVADFDNGGTAISMSATDGTDWINQLGMIEAARDIMRNSSRDGDDD